jgi:hypothetical protein
MPQNRMATELRPCKTCGLKKDLDAYEKTTKDGKCRRAVCKPCYAQLKMQRAKTANANVDKSSVSKPTACTECGQGEPDVEFKWRTDIKAGGWRFQCNSCYNGKGYSEKSRGKRRAEDPVEYLARNAASHLAWANDNRDKVLAQQQLTQTDPSRRFKALVTYVKQKHGEEGVKDMIDFDEADVLQAKMSAPMSLLPPCPRRGREAQRPGPHRAGGQV